MGSPEYLLLMTASTRGARKKEDEWWFPSRLIRSPVYGEPYFVKGRQRSAAVGRTE